MEEARVRVTLAKGPELAVLLPIWRTLCNGHGQLIAAQCA
jgi:hypothetical protein